MVNLILPIGVLAMLLLLVAQVRRLIEMAMLNRTIRRAMELNPENVPVLVEKLELPRTPDALVG